MTEVKTLTFNSFFENTYVVFDDTKQAVIIDPGMCYENEDNMLFNFIEENALQPVQVINTHTHIDHVLGLNSVFKKYGLKTSIHQSDEWLLKKSTEVAISYGYPEFVLPEYNTHSFLIENDIIEFGNTRLKVIFCPGHSPGHICFYCEEGNFLIGGDVLFYGSIGRTDLPGGNHEQLLENIRKKILTLPDDCVVYTGHGEPTEIGREKKHNPFFN